MVGVSSFWQQVIKGLVIVLAVIIDQVQARMQERIALQKQQELGKLISTPGAFQYSVVEVVNPAKSILFAQEEHMSEKAVDPAHRGIGGRHAAVRLPAASSKRTPAATEAAPAATKPPVEATEAATAEATDSHRSSHRRSHGRSHGSSRRHGRSDVDRSRDRDGAAATGAKLICVIVPPVENPFFGAMSGNRRRQGQGTRL